MTGRPESPVPFVAGAIKALLGAVLWTAPLGAHGLKVECEVTNENRIQIKISYEDGGVADLAAVRLLELTADGEEPAAVIAEGKADEKGVFSFPRPEPSEFRLEAEHAGHRKPLGVRIDPDGTVTLEPLVAQEPHDHSQKRIIQTILYLLLIVIGVRLVVRLIRGRPSIGTAKEPTTPNEATEPDTSAPAPDASPKEE